MQRRLGGAALARARAERLRNPPQGLANSLRGMGAGAQPPLFDRLHAIGIPVLLAVGEEDAKFRGLAARLAGGLPDARVAVVPRAGHAAHLEAPDAFAARLEAFLDEVEAGDATRAIGVTEATGAGDRVATRPDERMGERDE